VNTQRRDRARSFARDLLAWEHVVAQLNRDEEEYQTAVSRRNDARGKLEDAVRKAYQHYAYLLRAAGGLSVQYKTVSDMQTSLTGANVWAALMAESRAVGLGKLSASYVGQLVSAFDRDLTPKELFSQPYTNPTWPLIASDEDMRRVLFELATGDRWMLVDSEGNEIRPANPGQIQPATLQQKLQLRPTSADTPEPGYGGEPHAAGGGGNETTNAQPLTVHPPAGGSGHITTPPAGPTAYEHTTITVDYTSATDPARRERVWHLVRELASLLDPAKAHANDVQMFGFTIELNTRTGDASGLTSKAESVDGARVRSEPDEM
jgi:hypothetical protein